MSDWMQQMFQQYQDFTNPAMQQAKAAVTNQVAPPAASPGPAQASTALPQSPLAMQAQQNLAGALAKPLDFGGLPQLDYGAQAQQGARDAAYNQATSRLDPMWNQREEQQRTQLLNQGLDPSSEAYKNSMSDFGRQRNDAYSSAQNMAFGQGLAAQNQSFGQSQAARQQMLAEMLQGRSVPLQEYGALTGLDLGKAGYGLQAGRFNLDLAKFGADEDQRQYLRQLEQDTRFQRFLADILNGGANLAGGMAGLKLPQRDSGAPSAPDVSEPEML